MDIIKEKYYDLLFSLLLLTLPFSPAIPNILLGVLLLFLVLNYKTINFSRLRTIPFILFYTFFIYLMIKAIVLNTFLIDFKLYSRYLIILVLPVLFLKVNDVRLLKKTIILSVFLIICKSAFLLFSYYSIYNYFPLSNGFEVNQVLVLERPYIGFITLIGIVFSFEEAKRGKTNILYYLFCLLYLVFIILISARNSLLTFGLIASIYVFFYSKLTLSKKGFLIFSFFAVATTFLALHDNLRGRFYYSGSFTEMIKANTSLEPRAIIWPCAYNVSLQNDFKVLFGFKSEDQIITKLSECYGEVIVNNDQRKEWFQTTKYNTHNQFLGFYLLGGIFGLLLLISFFAVAIKEQKFNVVHIAILLSLIMFFLFENVLKRQFGCHVFAVLISICLLDNQVKDEKK